MKKITALLMVIALLFSMCACRKEEQNPTLTEETTTIELEQALFEIDGVKVLSLEGGNGLFVEKGGFDEVEGVATVRVKNDSDRMIDYAKLSFRVNEIERAEFEIKALPAGETATVMEISARLYNSDDKYELINNYESTFVAYGEQGMNEDKIKIETDGGKITVTNISDKDISQVIIYYKYYIDSSYYGGIAFRGTFENIKAGKSVSQTSDRFAQNGKIVSTSVVL